VKLDPSSAKQQSAVTSLNKKNTTETKTPKATPKQAGGTGGACFSPQLDPRPQYPPASEIFSEFAIEHTRHPLLAALFTKFVFWPLFSFCASTWLANGLSERLFFAFMTTFIHEVMYYGMNCTLLAFDHYGIFAQYKLDRSAVMEVKEELLSKTIKSALVGHLIFQPLTLYFMYPIVKSFGMPAINAPLPGMFELFCSFLINKLVWDNLFYWAHRVLHMKALYKHIHKQHHQYTGSIGFAAEYAHFVESLVSNQLPTFLTWFVGGFHMCSFMSSLVIKLESTYETHSGYCFQGTWLQRIGLTNSRQCAFHDFHHSKNRGNFGHTYLDWMFGTMDGWIAVGGLEGYIALKKKREQAEAASKAE
jgi:sterol desaturase/sphingolipid hydroxylase (fatty acid hydroxylase superfamily)